MSYMWNEFNIKTFPAETIVYRDGLYCDELSTLPNAPINTKYDLPVHLIYVGEIDGEKNLYLDVGVKNQNIFVSANIKIKKSAVLNIFIKNAGENSEINGTVCIENTGDLKYNLDAQHLYKKTAILIKNKVFAGKNSNSKLYASAIIKNKCKDCVSDVAIVAMAEQGAKIEFMPAQYINAEPLSAEHSASIFKPTNAQIFYMRGAGLSSTEIDNVFKEAFLS